MLFCNIVWALNVVVSKIAVSDLDTPPLFYALLRSIIVALALFPLLRPVPKELGKVMLIGLAISGGSFALLFMGLATASPSAAGVVSLSGAPMTVLFAILFLGAHPLETRTGHCARLCRGPVRHDGRQSDGNQHRAVAGVRLCRGGGIGHCFCEAD